MSTLEKKQRHATKKKLKQPENVKEQKEADAEWDRAFASSRDALAKLAAKARKEHKEGRTEDLDPDNL